MNLSFIPRKKIVNKRKLNIINYLKKIKEELKNKQLVN